MSEATHEFAHRVAQVPFHSGKDSFLHLAALRDVLRECVMNYGSSQGRVPLAPNQRGGIYPSLEIGDQ